MVKIKTAAELSAAVFGLEMRKNLLWMLLLPVLLCSAILWARQAAWNQLEEEFRKQLFADLSKEFGHADNKWLSAEIYINGNDHDLGSWNKAETKAILADIHLAKPSDYAPSSSKIYLRFYAPSGDCYKASGFGIALDGTQGYVGSGVEYGEEWSKKWRGFGLTPQSCRALKKRALARWGKQITAARQEAKQ